MKIITFYINAKISWLAIKYNPGTFLSASPSIVYVFPLPVYPYAKQVHFALLKAA